MKWVLIGMALVGAVWSSSVEATAQNQSPAVEKLYFHPYQRPLSGSFQLQPGQGFALVEPFSGVVRMVQICVRDAKSVGQMPIPTPTLATRRSLGGVETLGNVPVGGCSVIEGEGVYVGLVDGTSDPDLSDTNARKNLAVMTGTYTVFGYYNSTPPEPMHRMKDPAEIP